MKKIFIILILICAAFGDVFAQPTSWASSFTQHGLIIGNFGGQFNATSAGVAGQLIVSGGSATDPGWLGQGTTGYFLSSNGTGNNPTWKASGQPIVLTADTLTTGQSLIGTGLQFNAVDTQSTYRFEIIGFDTSSSSAGVKFGFAIPSGATIKAQVQGQTTAVTATSWDVITAGATAGIAYATGTSTNNGGFRITGTVKIGSTAGNVIFEFLKGTSGTGGILAGSMITWSKV